jgi:hypothetical protein
MSKTVSKTSPKGGKRGCLCDDGTYKKECCTGELQNQGIGSTVSQSTATYTNTNNGTTTVTQRG